MRKRHDFHVLRDLYAAGKKGHGRALREKTVPEQQKFRDACAGHGGERFIAAVHDAVETPPAFLAARDGHPGAVDSPFRERGLRVKSLSLLVAHLRDVLHADPETVVGELRERVFDGNPDPRAVVGFQLVAVQEEVVHAGLRKDLLHLRRGAGGDDEIRRAQKLALQNGEPVVRVTGECGHRKRIPGRRQPAAQRVDHLARVVSAHVDVGQGEQNASPQHVPFARQNNGSGMRSRADVSLPRQAFRHAAGLGEGKARRLANLADGRKLFAARYPPEGDPLFYEAAQGVHQIGGAVRHEFEILEDVSHGKHLKFARGSIQNPPSIRNGRNGRARSQACCGRMESRHLGGGRACHGHLGEAALSPLYPVGRAVFSPLLPMALPLPRREVEPAL